MTRVSEASTTGPEGAWPASSPRGQEGSAGGLSKLIRSDGGLEALPVPFVSSNSNSVRWSSAFGAVRSYRLDALGTAEAM